MNTSQTEVPELLLLSGRVRARCFSGFWGRSAQILRLSRFRLFWPLDSRRRSGGELSGAGEFTRVVWTPAQSLIPVAVDDGFLRARDGRILLTNTHMITATDEKIWDIHHKYWMSSDLTLSGTNSAFDFGTFRLEVGSFRELRFAEDDLKVQTRNQTGSIN